MIQSLENLDVTFAERDDDLAFPPQSHICFPLPYIVKTINPRACTIAIGRNIEIPQLPPVISRRLPVNQTPIIPGNAPAVFEMPSKAAAYFGDKSW